MGEQETTSIAVLQEKVKFLEIQLGAIQNDIRDKFDRLEVKLDLALKAIQSGRPTWAIALLLGGLMTVCSSLIVFIAVR